MESMLQNFELLVVKPGKLVRLTKTRAVDMSRGFRRLLRLLKLSLTARLQAFTCRNCGRLLGWP